MKIQLSQHSFHEPGIKSRKKRGDIEIEMEFIVPS
jgi:hypothetical protein